MSTILRRTTAATGVAAAVLALVAGTAGAGQARGSAVTSSGTCTGHSTWMLKAKADDRALEVEAQVDTNRVGRRWSVRLTDDGAVVGRGSFVTRAPSGSFTVVRHPVDRAGRDRIVLTARDTVTGETCSGTVVLPG